MSKPLTVRLDGPDSLEPFDVVLDGPQIVSIAARLRRRQAMDCA